MMHPDLVALLLTLKLAAISTLILLLIGLPVAHWLARSNTAIARLVETIIALPLVLPPTVIGFYLLIAFAPQGTIGGLWQTVSSQPLAFSFGGLVAGSVIFSMPFVVQPLQSAFEQLPRELLDMAQCLGANAIQRFRTVTLPLISPGIVTAAMLGFAHTLGEFGVVLMIGGNIPGETRVLAIALYDHIETLEYQRAHRLAGGMLLFSFILMLWLYGNRARLRLR